MSEQYDTEQNMDRSFGNTAVDFDNPPQGPSGVHRGRRSFAVRSMPFVLVIVLAIILGLISWMVISGNFAKIEFPWSHHSTTSQQAPSSATPNKNADGQKPSVSDENGKANVSPDAKANENPAVGNPSQNSSTTPAQPKPEESPSSPTTESPTISAPPAAPIRKDLAVRVANGTHIAGYAGRLAKQLQGAGYAHVVAVNARGTLPAHSVVWYKSADGLSAAQDIAKILGIATVEQTNAISSPIVVVLVK